MGPPTLVTGVQMRRVCAKASLSTVCQMIVAGIPSPAPGSFPTRQATPLHRAGGGSSELVCTHLRGFIDCVHRSCLLISQLPPPATPVMKHFEYQPCLYTTEEMPRPELLNSASLDLSPLHVNSFQDSVSQISRVYFKSCFTSASWLWVPSPQM